MTETPSGLPNRAWFKPSEVCEIAGIQSYVLRSWESEFPNLGVSREAGPGRLYRRSDVEQVLRIKRLVFEEGLTLAGVRRRIEGEPPSAAEAVPFETVIGDDVRARLSEVKQGLRSLLDMLSSGHPGRRGAAGGPVRAAGSDGAAPEAPASGEERTEGKAVDPVLPFNGTRPGEDSDVVPALRRGSASSPRPERVEGRRRRSSGGGRTRRAEEPPNG